jgi:hypothetical protein
MMRRLSDFEEMLITTAFFLFLFLSLVDQE